MISEARLKGFLAASIWLNWLGLMVFCLWLGKSSVSFQWWWSLAEAIQLQWGWQWHNAGWRFKRCLCPQLFSLKPHLSLHCLYIKGGRYYCIYERSGTVFRRSGCSMFSEEIILFLNKVCNNSRHTDDPSSMLIRKRCCGRFVLDTVSPSGGNVLSLYFHATADFSDIMKQRHLENQK